MKAVHCASDWKHSLNLSLQRHLSWAIVVQSLHGICAPRNAFLRPRAYVNSGHPRGLLEVNQDETRRRGNLVSGILHTWPAHCNCLRKMYFAMSCRPIRCRNCSFEILCSRTWRMLTLQIRLMQSA